MSSPMWVTQGVSPNGDPPSGIRQVRSAKWFPRGVSPEWGFPTLGPLRVVYQGVSRSGRPASGSPMLCPPEVVPECWVRFGSDNGVPQESLKCSPLWDPTRGVPQCGLSIVFFQGIFAGFFRWSLSLICPPTGPHEASPGVVSQGVSPKCGPPSIVLQWGPRRLSPKRGTPGDLPNGVLHVKPQLFFLKLCPLCGPLGVPPGALHTWPLKGDLEGGSPKDGSTRFS